MNNKVVLISGLIGVGKSTVAKKIAKNIKGVHLRKDSIRNKLYPQPTFSKIEQRNVNNAFIKETENLINLGENIVLDATFLTRNRRKEMINLLGKYNIRPIIVEVICNSDKEVKKRIKKRGTKISKGDYKQYLISKKKSEKILEDKIIIDNSNNLIYTYKQINHYF